MQTIAILVLILDHTLGVVSSFGPVLGTTRATQPSASSLLIQNAEKTPRELLYEFQDALPKVAGRLFDRTLDFFVDAAAGEGKVRSSPKFSKQPVEKKRRVMLALDGGGVRGLITTYVLQALEEEINTQAKKMYGEEKFKKDLRIGEVFDVVAGTSTGALLATYLTSYSLHNPRTIKLDDGDEILLDGTARGATEMYKAFAKKIFPPPVEPKGRWQRAKNALWNRLPFPETRASAGQIYEIATERSLHSDDGLNEALGKAFPREMSLNWLAETEGKMIDGVESTVTSLFVISYDMVYRRPVAFYADRDFHRARFLAADPFIEPYSNPSSLRNEITKRRDKMEENFKEYKAKHQRSELFQKSNLGDSDIPMHKEQVAGNHPRYSRALTANVPITLNEVCRCSVAAPVYLPPGYVEGFFINEEGNKEALVCCDGGVVANAPAQACFNTMFYSTCAESLQNNITLSGIRSRKAVRVEDFASQMVMSIGCGQL